MAKAKKQLQTLEEILVLETDQPYKVPENWVWVRLGAIAQLNPPKIIQEPIPEKVSFVPMAAVSEISGSIFDVQERLFYEVSKGYTPFIENDVLFAKITPCMENGKAAIARNLINGIGFGSTEFYIFRPSKCLSVNLLYYLFRAQWFRDEAKENMAGAVGQQRVKKEFLINYKFPLPPLSEQYRIVERIESLFEKLDRAKELAQNALESFETRKAAILHKAFTGELTAKWREENGVDIESWENTTTGILFEYVTSGSRGWAQYYSDTGSIFYRMGNLDHGTIELDLTDIQYVQLPENAEGTRSKLKKNDILISITADVGMVGFVRNDRIDAYINQHVALARPISKVFSEWLAWFLVSDLGLRQLQRRQRGATKIGLSLSDIKSVEISLPSLPEQHEIVRILDSLFEKEQRARELCDVIDKIDLMKKAILARAFRGELGTNDPSEESAVNLLLRQ
jgi:type I restriction enzyme S subunit